MPRSNPPRPAEPEPETSATASPIPPYPREPYGRLFLRFLRFGLLAFGGPVAQIAMIRRELVDQEGWITADHFHRVFAVYQVLPGPEAHELCVYFGMRAGGRLGGLLAGLGFMLPGLGLMLALSWAYAHFGAQAAGFAALFYGTQPAVAAVVVRAVHRIGAPVLTDPWLWGIAAGTAMGEWAGLPFLATLTSAGLAYVLARTGRTALAGLLLAGVLAAAVVRLVAPPQAVAGSRSELTSPAPAPSAVAPPPGALLGSGLRAGLLTFGGAYTVIPFLRRDAVVTGGWMTDSQFLDGLALSGILPAPLVIVGTFVGYLGGGLLGALAVTLGIFLPAFAFTLVAHDLIEGLVTRPALHTFLAGVTAGVIGLIAVAAVILTSASVRDLPTLGIAAGALLVLYRFHLRLVVPLVVLAGGLIGWLVRTVLT